MKGTIVIKAEAIAQAKNAYRIEKECIEEMLDYFDEASFSAACDLILQANRIGTSGCGHSGILCQHFSHLLCCIELSAKFISPAEAVHGGMGFLQKDDVIFLVSRGGKTSELLPIAQICKKKGIKIISITENTESELASVSNVVLKQHVNRETDKYNSQGTTSSTALCTIFHAIVTALIEEIDYKNETFAVIHPGGAVGERLNNL